MLTPPDGPPAYAFELPGYVTPLLNETLRTHFRKRRNQNKALAWMLRCAYPGPLPPIPLPRSVVQVVRRSIGSPDQDGLVGGFKSLLDCLQPVSARHPHGLGFIADDSQAALTLIPVAERVRTRAAVGMTIRIWPYPASI